MRSLLLCFLVATCISLVAALPSSIEISSIKDYLATLTGRSDDRLIKRDSCDEILAKTGEEPYVTCFNLLQPVLFDNPGSTESQVNDYCTAPEDCPTNIRNLFTELTLACQGGDPGPVQTRIVTEICHPDPRGTYCGIDYISEFDDKMEDAYDNCLQEYDGGKGCTDNCQTVTTYINDNLGCCYTIIQQFQTQQQGVKGIDSKVFEACGLTEPEPCSD